MPRPTVPVPPRTGRAPEHHATFACFGGSCAVHVAGDGPLGPADEAIESVRQRLLAWHARFSRFLPDSELSRLNAHPGAVVPAGPTMRRLARATVEAARRSGGLVDATLLGELRDAGYAAPHDGVGLGLTEALAAAPTRRAAGPDPRRRWAAIEVDEVAGTVRRPPGVGLDPGGLAKGLFADLVAERLDGHERWVISCCGDLRLGGTLGAAREVRIEHPFGGTAHVWSSTTGAEATSGIGRRSWHGPDGRPAHHLLDPATGRPAFTGIVQASALAPTALEAEWRSKAALLAGPAGAAARLPHGGLLVLDDATVRVLEPPAAPPTAGADAARRAAGGGTTAAGDVGRRRGRGGRRATGAASGPAPPARPRGRRSTGAGVGARRRRPPVSPPRATPPASRRRRRRRARRR